MAAIVLNGKTYTPIGWDPNGVSVYSEQSGGVPSSFSKLTDKVTVGVAKSNSNVKWKLAIPVVATTDSDCSCAGDLLRTMYLSIESTFAPGATLAERTDFYDRLVALVASPEFSGSIKALTQSN